MIDDLVQAIRSRDAQAIHTLLFEGAGGYDPSTDRPRAKSPIPVVGHRGRTESEIWDYKSDVPRSEVDWAITARHVLAFHNHRGGVMIYGVRDSDYSYVGATERLDSKLFNDKIRRFLGDIFWVDFHRIAITERNRYLGLAIIPPRGGQMAFFVADAPLAGGKRDFLRGESALRRGDSSLVLTRSDALTHQASFSPTLTTSFYSIDEPFFRIFALETDHFVPRPSLRKAINSALDDPRTSISSLVGVGGSGKTTLATAAALEAHDAQRFAFVVSVTAKDRELVTEGIRRSTPSLTTYDTLLTSIADVLGFPELKHEQPAQQEAQVRSLLADSGGLLYVDNLETVDDPRVIEFLDDLPVGVKALVTSRRMRVRVAARPVDVGPLSQEEASQLIRSLADLAGLGYVADLTSAEIERISGACDHLPLAIRWTLLRAGQASEAVQRAEQLRAAGRRESELLEFTFRRVFDDMSTTEKAAMRTLSILHDASSLEGVIAGTGVDGHLVVDALDELVGDALVQRSFDSELNAYAFSVAPLTRAFLLTEMRASAAEASAIRRRLVEWYEARDVGDPEARVVVRDLRQGRASPEGALLDIAQAAQRRGDSKTAQAMYEQALERNPASWRAARLLAEFERHVNRDQGRALQYYEQAAHHAPARGNDRALIFREWGMLLRESGRADATDQATEKFEVALKETPNDPLLIHALAMMYDRKGVYRRVIELLEPLRRHPSPRNRKYALTLLVKAYDRTTALLEAAEARAELRELDETA
jgi:tetratricopeptide (TPR) repeat protein